REQIAPPAAIHLRQAFVLQPQRGAGLRPLGHFDGIAAVERGYLNLTAERERAEIDRNLAVQVLSVAPEELVLLHVHDDVEMPGRTAGGSRFAFALQSQLLARGDAGGDLDSDLALPRHVPRAVTCLTGFRDDASGSTALRACLRQHHEAMLTTNLTLTATHL